MRVKRHIASLILGCFSLASVARAHGGPPEIERVVAVDQGGPWLVELSEGFALRSQQDGSWSFVCPAAFGADLPPPAVAVARDDVRVAGATDGYRLNELGVVSAENRQDLASSRVLALGALDGGLLVLRLRPPQDTGGARGTDLVLLRGEAEATLFEAPELWSALAVLPTSDGPQLWLARIEGQGVELLNMSAGGEAGARQLLARPASPASIRLSTAGDHVFLHILDSGGYWLRYVGSRDAFAPAEPELLVSSTSPVRGPAAIGGEVLLTRDEELVRITDGGVVPVDHAIAGARLTCLDSEFACAQSRLYANEQVAAAGGFRPEDALLDLARLGAPVLSIEDSELRRHCSAQWLVFQADLVRVGIAQDGGAAVHLPDGGPDAGPSDGGALDAKAAWPSDAGGSAAAPSSCGCFVVAKRERANSARAWLLVFALASSALYARRRCAHAARR